MNELIIRYYYGDIPTCQVTLRTNIATQETERFPFTFNISQEDRGHIQWYLEDYRSYPYGAFQYRAKTIEKLMFDIGKTLFNEIFHNKEDKAQDAIRFYNRLIENPTTYHIIVHSDSVAGWSLPWELLYDPVYGYLVQKVAGFVRSHSDTQLNLKQKPISLKDTSKINILMIVSRPDGKEDPVPFQSMARPLLKIFQSHKERIHVDLLRPPTFEKLQRVLSEKPDFYHILHFDGHGEFSQSIRDNSNTFLSEEDFPGQLVFRKTGGGPDMVSGAKLGQLLSEKGVPIVILNACQSGMSDPESLYPSVGGELIKTGALGVVAMAYSVYADTAVDFMKEVYESLINGKTLSRAVTVARNALAEQDKRDSPIGLIPLQDWIVPVLFQSGEVQLFPSSVKKLKLDLNITKGKPTDVGTEINLSGKPIYGFIGRDYDILNLEEAFENETIVLLKAMAGEGKSATAIGFARWWEATGALEGPIFFFSFESYINILKIYTCIGVVLKKEIKKVLNLEWDRLDFAKRRSAAIDILRKVPCFLIWDSLEPIAGFPRGTSSNWKKEEQEELKEFLKALNGGATKVILTSRKDEEWLDQCYKLVKLQGLNSLDSMKLAGRILKEAKINRRTLKPYHKLLKYLQGNPLAIQVILPEIAHLEPEALLAQLQTGEARLSEEDKNQDRQHSLTASLSFGLDKLDKLFLSRLGLLSLFQGFVREGFLTLVCDDKDAPKLLKGLKRENWLRMLDQATEMGLLQKVRTNSYRIHPALPWFFHGILHTVYEKDMKWLEKRFVTVCDDISRYLQEMLHEDTETGIFFLHLEEQNLRYGIRLGVGYKMWDIIESAFLVMVNLLEKENRWSECEFLTEQVKEKATDRSDLPNRGAENLCVSLWYNLGRIAQEKRQFKKAEQWYKKSLVIEENQKNEYAQAHTLHQIGRIAQEKRQFKKAEELFSKSLTIEEELKDEYGQATTLHNLGRIAWQKRQFKKAEELFSKSLNIEEKLKDEYTQAITLHQLGLIAWQKRQFKKAEEWYKKSLAIAEKLKDELGGAHTLHNLGIIAQGRQQFDEAEQWYKKSLAITEKLKDEYTQETTLHQIGRIAQEKRQFKKAEQWYKKSLAIAEKLKDKQRQRQTLNNLGKIAQQRRQFKKAEQWYKKSLAIAGKLKDEDGQAITLNNLGIIAQQKRQFKKAEQWYKKSLAIAEKLKDKQGQAQTLNNLGIIAQQRQQFDEAEQWFKKSLAIAGKLKHELERAKSLHLIGMIAQEKRQFKKAEEWYKKSLAIAGKLKHELGQEDTLNQLGRIAVERKQFKKAEEWYKKSLAIAGKLKDEDGQVTTLNNLGIIAQQRQQFDEAEQWYKKSLAIAKKLKDEYAKAATLYHLGTIAQEKQQFEDAERLYLEAETIFKKYPDTQILAIVQSSLERLRKKKKYNRNY